ncbi:ethanolamine utilization protein EutH [Salibacterium halotolerans]|uniref:Ethanolamine transporter n=1 Tax=Salibacterium halotolerans TaxID=1884432 RepID=A0A1I5XPF7_9BACI|nr:ethanolamine utilization protein EutH [Salibacterium halotolerans]SFQ33875.1 ethanolamine transporter [Salibacterium halotolerans]
MGVLQDIVIWILAVFMVIGTLDKVFGNKYGYGGAFDRGFAAMGPVAVVIVGMISLAPVLADILRPVIAPVYQWLGADPAMFATTILALDMGGWALAGELAETEESARFAGILLGSMLGATLTFTVPIALSILKKEDHALFAKGMLAGITTIPVGMLAGGAVAGFSMQQMLGNLVPIFIVSGLILLGLWWKMEAMVQGFRIFGRLVTVVTTLATAVVVLQALTGWTIIDGMAPSREGILTVGTLAFTLAGAFPLVHFFQQRIAGKDHGSRFFMNPTAWSGWCASLAHIIPMFTLSKEMDDDGKLMNYAFAVSGAFLLGGHLGYTAAVNEAMIVPLLAGKLAGGISAMGVAYGIILKSKTSISDNTPEWYDKKEYQHKG